LSKKYKIVNNTIKILQNLQNMAIKVAIDHYTAYKFDRAVSLSPHVIRLRPAAHSRTAIKGYSLSITPKKHFLNWQQDPYGNYLARVVFPEKTTEMSVRVEVIADMAVINPFDFFLEEYAQHFPFVYEEELKEELKVYLELSEDSNLLSEWVKKMKAELLDNKEEVRTIDFLVAINSQLNKEIGYNIRMEPGVQSCQETLTLKTGSCRDSGWLLVQILRHFGLAARFVSGYLVQLAPDIAPLDGPAGPKEDFTDLHAWCEVYIPGAGWIGLDPTSGLFASEGHIPLACTPKPSSAAAIFGYTDKCESKLEYHNKVMRIHEDPRVTKPYSDDHWELINALGRKVDEELLAGDVRLTMGGEPTFVSIDDMESPQWNTAADGTHKRQLAGDLILRLRDSFGKGGLLHYGLGKWYPGEPFPRWQLGCFWRKDGKVMWQNEKLLARDTVNYGFGVPEANKFIRALAKRLEISELNISAAYEDPLEIILQESKIPINIDPLKYNLKDNAERQKLAKDLMGIGMEVGYALPIQWNYNRTSWQSCTWEFRRGNLFLIPGNSPMGLRLPLNTLPYIAPEKREIQPERSLFDDLPPLADYKDIIIQRTETPIGQEYTTAKTDVKKQVKKDKDVITEYTQVIRTALCVEPRDGRIHVFMPPVSYLEHYLDLLARIEATADELKMPVMIEGYEPPRDYRIERLMVTPDPGVIEVNIHPARTWDELVNNTFTLYEQARLSRLTTEKFMLDGKHTGTGGGNHITIGGPSPSDSPLLRRPDLLRSIITYWQNHPGLSYLFSSAFVGPTSQAPRIDEGRDEKLYELEIAFDELDRFPNPPFWIVDRLLRNLMVDLTGNTHRAELCIDKLYSPDSSSGRLGILEFRGFDMPPHARMSLVQNLLIRTLIAWFWKRPYRHKLVRWGTELHDKFMLSHYVREDLRQIVSDLNDAGYPFRMEWFDAFFEFRFPVYGSVQIDSINIELRAAIEPWHVLGEEMSSGGTARFVDSSVERLEVKITGITDSRYMLLCNGRRIPMKSTGVHGEYVAGIRYRAWQPPSALHPTIGVHSPLVFDLVDSWNGKAIGGCTYHVSHPGGRSYETFPINAYEAESRRHSRFWENNHTIGTYQQSRAATKGGFVPKGSPTPPPLFVPASEVVNAEYPYTLDLRRNAKFF
jgi:uncharacterized protein (DUF2126 family)/transglutaminase-like putative cysteine protease